MSEQSSAVTVHQAIARALFENGVDTIFGLMGDANMYMVESFIRECGGKFIAAANEAGAACMALGYAAASNKVGVCSVTHGPAMVNTATALVHGVKASLPMLLLCGDTNKEDRTHTQNIAQREFVIAAGAGFEQLRTSRTVAEDVATVLRRAIVERRPVALNVPHELDWKPAENFAPIRIRIPDSRATVSSSDDLDAAIGIIATAKRPIVLAGRGAKSPAAKSALLRLSQRIEAPVATTLKAKDLFRGEDCNLGIVGTISMPGTVETLMESDCIVAFGASLHTKTMSNGTFRKGRRIVQVNLEPTEIARHYEADAAVVGDPAAVADLIVHWLDEAEVPPSGFRSDEIRQRIAADAAELNGSGENERKYYRAAVRELNRILPENRVLLTDVGRFMLEVWTMIDVDGPASFISTSDFGSIGLGLSHAVGASFGTPGRPAVVFCGDGGFMHGGLAEFNTAVRHNADLIVVVCNDGAYGAEQMSFHRRQMDAHSIFFDWPDFAPVAIALGGEGVTVRTEADWSLAEQAIKGRTRALLIDLKLDAARMPLY